MLHGLGPELGPIAGVILPASVDQELLPLAHKGDYADHRGLLAVILPLEHKHRILVFLVPEHNI